MEVCMSVSTRVRSLVFVAVITAAALTASTVRAQDQGEPPTARHYCIKVTPGKDAEFRAFLRDVMVPLNQALADAGDLAWFVAARSIVPAGSSAPCDYRMVYGYEGLPPDPAETKTLEAALQRAKLDMTWDQYVAKRSSFTTLVAAEIWWRIESVGPQAEKGSYVRANRNKVQNGELDEWIRMERTYWKPIMEAWLKGGGKGSWSVHGLWMPAGDSMPYNSMTLDFYPDWNGLLREVFSNDLWFKVHPGITATAVFSRFERIRSVHDREVYRLAEVVRAK
jgi:hypothetical protein